MLEHTHIRKTHSHTNCVSQTGIHLFVCSAFYCLFVPSFVSILHSNLFSPQTNCWRAAICKTEQGGSTELERTQDEETETEKGKGEKRRSGEKQGSMEEGKLRGNNWAGKRKGKTKWNGRGEFMLCPSTWAHSAVSSAWWLRITLYSCGLQVNIWNFSAPTRWRVAVAFQQTLPLCVSTGHGQMVENWRRHLNHTEHMHMGEFAKTQGMGCKARIGACWGWHKTQRTDIGTGEG